MRNRVHYLAAALWALAFSGCGWFSSVNVIMHSESASSQEKLAAREIRRYIYQSTGELLPISASDKWSAVEDGMIVVAAKGSPLLEGMQASILKESISRLGDQSFLIKRESDQQGSPLMVVGGDPIGTLYGAYRLAEEYGVRFYLHGDVIPDEKVAFEIPRTDVSEEPLFPLRGILPFHDFPEGPDWWNEDDYKAILSQLPKLRMNFIGLHTYPEGGPNAEPTVWIGLEEEARPDGTVTASYSSSYQNTVRGNWGYSPRPTSQFGFGSSQLFEEDQFGAEVMAGKMPAPEGARAQNDLFNQAGKMLGRSFTLAQSLGIKTCVGTETPLKVPDAVKARLREMGKNPDSPKVLLDLYKGMFSRISNTYPIDYYWLWTNEGWTWSKVSDQAVKDVEADLLRAVAAVEYLDTPFNLATCGWVLGPPKDRTQFDRILPKNIPFSCINRQLGKDPVDVNFRRLQDRPKWAIPWMEDDPRMISPQLWVGRMRKDAFDARNYGCDGLMGIHWRTKVVGPTVAALARAGWDQNGWSQKLAAPELSGESVVVHGGEPVTVDGGVEGSSNPELYLQQREGAPVYEFQVPNGTYTVALHFAEMEFGADNRRVFHGRLQGDRVAESLDIFSRVGARKPLVLTFKGVEVTDGQLVVDFVPVVGSPAVAAIEVEGRGVSRKINCGGGAVGRFQAEPEEAPEIPRHAPTDDFYLDWAKAQFGLEVASEVAEIFSSQDGNLHEPSQWLEGPGGINTNTTPWSDVATQYAFIDRLHALDERVRGEGNRNRFSYWLNTFHFMKETARIGCTLGELDEIAKEIGALPNSEARRARAEQTMLPVRERLLEEWGRMMGFLLATVDTSGELGTVANIEQHSLEKLGLLTKHDKVLEEALGRQLGQDLMPWHDYRGPLRLIVPTRRGLLEPGEDLVLKIIVLSPGEVEPPVLYWRELGHSEFTAVEASHQARGVFTVRLPAPDDDVEYYVSVLSSGQEVKVPATAPSLNQVVVVAKTVM